ncbi:hypothetical protein KIN20_033674 [Parelaphostrongylus tenuis]|uniref:Uncharacterized protein n=1 Tax=Parelaphostrongylus tenuis TaxID=148309 RepID=A0AAD5WIF9_PARTN|nr:hypothetical protein KIN20_033674 [Parelaphostrongylus tenuis]
MNMLLMDVDDEISDENSVVDAERLLIIDYEFGCYNYRAFEIANHLAEYGMTYGTVDPPHYQVDVELMENEDLALPFCKAYLDQIYKDHVTTAQLERQFLTGQREKDLNILMREYRRFLPLSHLFWGIWHILCVQELGMVEGIDFSTHAKDRFIMYYMFKSNIDNITSSIVKVKLDARGGVVLWEDWCAAWTGVSQSMGRRRQESSAFNWSVRPPGNLHTRRLTKTAVQQGTLGKNQLGSGTKETTSSRSNHTTKQGKIQFSRNLTTSYERVEAKISMSPALSSSQAVLTRASNQLAKDLDSNEAIIKDTLGLPQERRESKEDINTLRVKLRRAINELDFRVNNVQAALDKYNTTVDQLGASACVRESCEEES